MALDIFRERGVPLEEQAFDWKELVRSPYSKLDDDAFTRVRVLVMTAIESQAVRFSHACARTEGHLRLPLARVRRIEQHQQTLVGWLAPPDQTALETAIAFAQAAIEVTAWVAQHEPDASIREIYEHVLVEDVDHLYRYAALMDRMEGRDANAILQSHTDIVPGRPTSLEHRAPEDALPAAYDRVSAYPITKLAALTVLAVEQQKHDFTMTIGPTFSDPVARQLFAEVASIGEQQITEYESMLDSGETWIEKWLLHEACEVYGYHSCLLEEPNERLRKVWERFLDYELGHLHAVMRLFERFDGRDPAEVLPSTLPEPLEHGSQREYVREVLIGRQSPRANGAESEASAAYRNRLNRAGSPSELVAAGYRWAPGTELSSLATRSAARAPHGRG